ncbi:MAG TPA: hypothetical protein VKI18_17960 [Albitalea sp.]|nr:hypothetical protein [Albitalea sp.]
MKLRTLAPTLLLMLAAPLVLAKLPPLSPEAQAKADEAKAKTAWTDKVAAYQLCRSMDRVVDGYRKSAKASGKAAPEPLPTPPCTDPGPYMAQASASAPPPEASGARSPSALQGTKQK